MPATLVYAIHGFLGRASDWVEVEKILPNVSFVAEELFSKNQRLDYFLTRVKSFESFQGKKIFLGYSLGGRLGLQLLKKTPDIFDHYCFLSTNPGLPSQALEERKNRIIQDKNWSVKISKENWYLFLQEWNSQPLLQGANAAPQRDIKNYDLQKLQEAQLWWSLGKQEDFSETIRIHKEKITWAVGDRDKRYCAIAEDMKNKKILLDYKKLSSGHRIWLDNPSAVASIIDHIVSTNF